jgi:hypothetical protein
MRALPPDAILLFLGVAPDRTVITFHFAPPLAPLTGWHDGTRCRWQWADEAGTAPPPRARDRFGPCEKRLLAAPMDRDGITFQWPGRAPVRYGWHDGGFRPEGAING